MLHSILHIIFEQLAQFVIRTDEQFSIPVRFAPNPQLAARLLERTPDIGAILNLNLVFRSEKKIAALTVIRQTTFEFFLSIFPTKHVYI